MTAAALISHAPDHTADDADTAPDSGTRTSLAAQALALLTLESRIAELRAAAAAIREPLISAMETSGTKHIVVKGHGAVQYVASSTRSNLDVKQAEAMLRLAGLAVPLSPVSVRASLRCAVNR